MALMTTNEINLTEENLTIFAEYAEDELAAVGDKDVTIFAICPAGNALEFDGVDDYIRNDVVDYNTSSFTLSVWVKANNTSQEPSTAIFASADSFEVDDSFQINFDDSGNYKMSHVDYNVSFGTAATDWQHLVITSTGTSHITYLNGAQANTNSTTTDTRFEVYKIGVNRNTLRYYDGLIDGVAIYNRALLPEEVQRLMVAGPDVDDPSLVAYYDFNEGQGQVAGDSSGNGNNGVLGSTPDADDNDPCWVDDVPPTGVCSEPEMVERNIIGAIEIKENILDELNTALSKEKAAQKMLRKMQRSRDHSTWNWREIIRARIKIVRAIIKERWSKRKIDQSADELAESLDILVPEVEPEE